MDGEVVISRFQAPYEAELAANYLREYGLTVRIDNDVLQGMNPLWGMALGGVRVYVTEAESERAKTLLAELDRQQPESSAQKEADPTRDFDNAARRALAAAVIGIFLLPFAAQLYSLVVAVRLRSSQLSARGRRHRVLALAVDTVVLGSCVYWLLRRA